MLVKNALSKTVLCWDSKLYLYPVGETSNICFAVASYHKL